jgi:peroxiredoxin Q/BCP
MSKKSRKKTSKTVPARKSAAQPPRVAKTKAKKARPSTGDKSAAKASSGQSHKRASKPLRSKAAKAAATTTGPKVPDSPALVEGARAPAFRLPRDGGSTISLSDFSGRKLVLFFYPKANTPGCTKEAIDFTRLSADFADSGTTVLGISADSPKAQAAFRDKHALSVPLISDEQHEILGAYGVWGEKSLYGRTFLGIIRTTVLVGADGRIARIWRNVRVDGHADAVLAAARAL